MDKLHLYTSIWMILKDICQVQKLYITYLGKV